VRAAASRSQFANVAAGLFDLNRDMINWCADVWLVFSSSAVGLRPLSSCLISACFLSMCCWTAHVVSLMALLIIAAMFVWNSVFAAGGVMSVNVFLIFVWSVAGIEIQFCW
jgi:hypothetical protein